MMKLNYISKLILGGALAFSMVGCYNEKEMHMPGMPDDYTPPSTGYDKIDFPFPFDSTRQAGKWLVKDGNIVPGMVTTKGITEFYSTYDRMAWEEIPGHGVASRQYYDNFNKTQYGLEGGLLPGDAFMSEYMFSNVMVPVGKDCSYYAYVRMSAQTKGGTAMAVLGGFSWVLYGSPANGTLRIGLDSGDGTYFFDLFSKNVHVPKELGESDAIIPGQPFDLEWAVVDHLLWFRVNGEDIFYFELPEGPKFMIAPFIRPWRSNINVYDFYVEATEYYTPDYAMIRSYEENESGEKYGIIQNASLAKKDNTLLLFSEGRVYPSKEQLAESNEIYGFTRTNQNRHAAGNSDIIMKKSEDGGKTWSQHPVVIAGQNETCTYADPQTISTQDGKIILQYISSEGKPTARDRWSIDLSTQRVWQKISEDGGTTWSDALDLSETYGVGPELIRTASGHGIEMVESDTYKGRFIMPLTYGLDKVKIAYSDDKGQTWTVGKSVSGKKLFAPSVIELNKDSLMMVASRPDSKTPGAEKTKYVSYSVDGGETWSDAEDIKANRGSAINTFYSYNFRGALVKRSNGDVVYTATINGEKDEKNALNGELDRGTEPHVKGGYVYPVEPKYWVMKKGSSSFDETAHNVFKPLVDQVPDCGMATCYAFKTFRPPLNHIDMIELNGKLIVAGSGGLESDREGIVIYQLD